MSSLIEIAGYLQDRQFIERLAIALRIKGKSASAEAIAPALITSLEGQAKTYPFDDADILTYIDTVVE